MVLFPIFISGMVTIRCGWWNTIDLVLLILSDTIFSFNNIDTSFNSLLITATFEISSEEKTVIEKR